MSVPAPALVKPPVPLIAPVIEPAPELVTDRPPAPALMAPAVNVPEVTVIPVKARAEPTAPVLVTLPAPALIVKPLVVATLVFVLVSVKALTAQLSSPKPWSRRPIMRRVIDEAVGVVTDTPNR